MTLLLIVSIVVCCVFTVFTIECFPVWLKKVMVRLPLINLALNFGVSWVIALFAGAGMYAGFGNLAGSIVGTLWVINKWSAKYPKTARG